MAKQPTGVSLENPQNYRFMVGRQSRRSDMTGMEQAFAELNQPEGEELEDAGGTVSSLRGPMRHTGSALDFH